jgi:hypothetical protein
MIVSHRPEFSPVVDVSFPGDVVGSHAAMRQADDGFFPAAPPQFAGIIGERLANALDVVQQSDFAANELIDLAIGSLVNDRRACSAFEMFRSLDPRLRPRSARLRIAIGSASAIRSGSAALCPLRQIVFGRSSALADGQAQALKCAVSDSSLIWLAIARCVLPFDAYKINHDRQVEAPWPIMAGPVSLVAPGFEPVSN